MNSHFLILICMIHENIQTVTYSYVPTATGVNTNKDYTTMTQPKNDSNLQKSTESPGTSTPENKEHIQLITESYSTLPSNKSAPEELVTMQDDLIATVASNCAKNISGSYVKDPKDSESNETVDFVSNTFPHGTGNGTTNKTKQAEYVTFHQRPTSEDSDETIVDRNNTTEKYVTENDKLFTEENNELYNSTSTVLPGPGDSEPAYKMSAVLPGPGGSEPAESKTTVLLGQGHPAPGDSKPVESTSIVPTDLGIREPSDNASTVLSGPGDYEPADKTSTVLPGSGSGNSGPTDNASTVRQVKGDSEPVKSTSIVPLGPGDNKPSDDTSTVPTVPGDSEQTYNASPPPPGPEDSDSKEYSKTVPPGPGNSEPTDNASIVRQGKDDSEPVKSTSIVPLGPGHNKSSADTSTFPPGPEDSELKEYSNTVPPGPADNEPAAGVFKPIKDEASTTVNFDSNSSKPPNERNDHRQSNSHVTQKSSSNDLSSYDLDSYTEQAITQNKQHIAFQHDHSDSEKMVTNVQTPLQKEEDRCVILSMVKKLKLAGHAKISAASWMCLFRHSSNYNFKLKKKLKNGHGFGLCQLNSRQHCKDGKASSKNVCKTSCSKFLNDDFKDDFSCLKKIVKSVKDLNAWPGWNNRCKGKNHKQYIAGCKP